MSTENPENEEAKAEEPKQEAPAAEAKVDKPKAKKTAKVVEKTTEVKSKDEAPKAKAPEKAKKATKKAKAAEEAPAEETEEKAPVEKAPAKAKKVAKKAKAPAKAAEETPEAETKEEAPKVEAPVKAEKEAAPAEKAKKPAKVAKEAPAEKAEKPAKVAKEASAEKADKPVKVGEESPKEATASGEEDSGEGKPEEKKEETSALQELLGDDLSGVKIRRAKGSKNVTHGIVHVIATFNNTKVTVTDTKGNVISWSSAGKCNFRGSRKSTAYAAQVVTQEATRAAMAHGLKEVAVHLKGPGLGRDSAVRALQALGMIIVSIVDKTPVPHNGCRPPKRRRV